MTNKTVLENTQTKYKSKSKQCKIQQKNKTKIRYDTWTQELSVVNFIQQT